MNEFINFLNETTCNEFEYYYTGGTVQGWHENTLILIAEIDEEKEKEILSTNYNDFSNIALNWQMV